MEQKKNLFRSMAAAAVAMATFSDSAQAASDRMLAFGESTPIRRSRRQHQTAFNMGRTAAKQHQRWLKARGQSAGTKLARRAAEGRIGLGHPR